MSDNHNVVKENVFEEVVRARRSVRGFLPESVPQDVLNEVFTLAQQAPSNCNTQPWLVKVVSGKACEQLRQKMLETAMSGAFDMDFPYDGSYSGVYKDRQYGAARNLYDAMGIAREEKEKRQAAFMKNFEFFGAPHVAFIFIPQEFGIREAADVGMYAQNLMLSMTAFGLASCPQTALSFHAGMVREQLGVSDDQKLLFGISFGYEDKSVDANQCRVPKAPLEETTEFIS